jgi:hypothetical protein
MMGWVAYTGVALPAAAWVVVIILLSAFVPLMLALYVFVWRRTYAKSPYLHKPLSGSVSRDRFVIEGATGRSDLTWDQFVRIREDKDFLLLYQAPNLFSILPRDFFESDADWEAARRFAMRTSADAIDRLDDRI